MQQTLKQRSALARAAERGQQTNIGDRIVAIVGVVGCVVVVVLAAMGAL